MAYLLEQTSLMPWGKYKGFQMQDVPACYLNFFWNKLKFKDDRQGVVAIYIRENLDDLRKERPDLRWPRE